MDAKQPLQIIITPGTVVSTVFILLGFWLAWYLRDLILVVLTAVVFASAIEPAAARMVRWGIPRVLAVMSIYLAVVLCVSLLFYFFVPSLVIETRNFVDSFPAYLDKVNVSQTDSLLRGVSISDYLTQLQGVLKASSSGLLATATAVFGGVMSFALIVVLSFYFAVQERGLDDFLRLVTPLARHDYMLDLWRRAQRKMGKWLQGQLLLSLVVAVMVYIGLLLLKVPYALLLALAAGVLELIPVFGSLLSAVPAVAVAFVSGSTSLALLTIVLYVVVNQLEGNVIAPLVVQKVLGVSPLVVILAIIVGAQLGGFLGVLIAVPIAAAIQEYVNDVQKGRNSLRYTSEEGVIT